jgi:hypothetical protein
VAALPVTVTPDALVGELASKLEVLDAHLKAALDALAELVLHRNLDPKQMATPRDQARVWGAQSVLARHGR